MSRSSPISLLASYAAAARRLAAAPVSPSASEAAMTSAFRVMASGAILTGLVFAYTTDPVVIGLLGALPFVARGAHLFAPRLIARFGAGRVTRLSGHLERLAFFGGAAAGVAQVPHTVAWLLLGLGVGSVSGAVYDMAVTALGAEMVGTRERGAFFGVRMRWASAFGVAAGFLGGLLVDTAEAHGLIPTTARGLTLLAGAFPALLATVALTRLERQRVSALAERAARRARGMTASARLLAVPGSRDPALRAALLFAAGWGLATGLIARHIDAFALGVLHFSVGTLAAVNGLIAGAGFIGAMTWGRLGDRFGAKAILTVAAILVSLNPLWYALSTPAHTWPFWWGQVLGGVANAGWVIGVPLLLLRFGGTGGSVRALALFQATIGLSAAVAPLLGGLLLRWLTPLGEQRAYMLLFGTSFVMRLAALRLLARVPDTSGYRTREMLRVIWRSQSLRVTRRAARRTPAGDQAA